MFNPVVRFNNRQLPTPSRLSPRPVSSCGHQLRLRVIRQCNAGEALAGRQAESDGGELGIGDGVGQTEKVVDHSLDPFIALLNDGRSFTCTQCGKCCSGLGEVWVSKDESEAIAEYLNLTHEKFLYKYTQKYYKYEGWYLLKSKQNFNKDCVFLCKDGKICTIHEVRPTQCSTYPWWPELVDKEDWETEKKTICEGFDHEDAGPINLQDAAKQLRIANKQNQMRMLSLKKKS